MTRRRVTHRSAPRPWPGLAGLCLLGLVTASAAADEMTTFSRVRFPQDVKRPLEITVGVVLVDFARINVREESFEVQGYLNLSWRVPSLASQGDRRMLQEELWSPNIDFVNALEPVKGQNESAFYVNNDGVVEQRVRFTGKFASQLDLRRFPLDEQRLKLIIEPFERTVEDVVFKVDKEKLGRFPSAFLSDWDIGGVTAEVGTDRHSEIGQTRSRFTLTIHVKRRSTFYIVRVLMPLILLVVASWGIYWVDPAQLQPQISTVVAVMLCVVVFNITIDFALPKVAYLTFIDTHATFSYLFMLASIAAVFVIHHRFNTHGIEAARRLQRRARFAFPFVYVAIVLSEIALFLF